MTKIALHPRHPDIEKMLNTARDAFQIKTREIKDFVYNPTAFKEKEPKEKLMSLQDSLEDDYRQYKIYCALAKQDAPHLLAMEYEDSVKLIDKTLQRLECF